MAEGNPLIVDCVPILILNSQLDHSGINILRFRSAIVVLILVIIIDDFKNPSFHLPIEE